MKNSLKYGILIGIISGIWILIMHYAGVFAQDSVEGNNVSWLEYASILIPAGGLYWGIKNYRDHILKERMEFFEGLCEGFKILIFGGIAAALFAAIYIQVNTNLENIDFMYRIGAAVLVGILFNLAISLILMNKQKHL
ncbi:MAG: DUF4199 domain-containing protein [Pedobacter sp.]|jgi:hypothetical protein